MKKTAKAILASLVLISAPISTTGCASFPFGVGVQAETYRQRLVQAEVAFQTILERAIAYKEAGRLSDEQVADLGPILLAASTMLDAANEAEQLGLETDFERRIALFQQLLAQATLMLEEETGIVGIPQ